jgi:hypothetical protein
MQKFSMKQLACTVALAGVCTTASAIEERVFDLGTLPVGATAFSAKIIGGPINTFNDFYKFVLPANGGSGYEVRNLSVQVPELNIDFDLAFTAMSLWSVGADGTFGGGNDVEIATSAGSGPLALSFGTPSAQSQNMMLVVQGFVVGSTGGIYNGAISVSPIPEPEAWAMMLIGAGLVGFRLRTRSKKTAAQRFA